MNKILINEYTQDEFRNELRNIVKAEIREALNPQVDPDKFYSREEAAEMLHISKPTLYMRTKNGQIKASYFGKRVLYKHKDIMSALESVVTIKA